MKNSENKSSEKTQFGGLSRSKLMSRIKSNNNTTTELKMIGYLRKYKLKGWRRNAKLSGKPDFIWRKDKVVLFVDGCFWHGHNCDRNLTPKTNSDFWEKKIRNNRKRDDTVNKILIEKGWKVVRIWECQLRKSPNACLNIVVAALNLSI